MKKLLLLLFLTPLLMGCPSSIQAPAPPLAPGYTSPTDQQFGQALAAARALANQAVMDYGKLTPAQQAQEKNALNGYVAAVNAADSLYQAYHVGQASPAQVTAAINQVDSAQTAFTNVEVKKVMGFLPLIGLFGNIVITLVGSLAGLTPANQTLAQSLLNSVLPLIGSIGAGNTKLQDVLAVLAGYSAIIATLKADPSTTSDKLVLLDNLGAEVQAATIAYLQAGKGYDPANYAPVSPVS